MPNEPFKTNDSVVELFETGGAADKARERLRRQRPDNSLESAGGGGYDGGMEARVAVLEQIAKDTRDVLGKIDRRMERIEDSQRADFRVLFGALITAALGLAALMAHGFHWL